MPGISGNKGHAQSKGCGGNDRILGFNAIPEFPKAGIEGGPLHGLVSAEREDLDRPEKGLHFCEFSLWFISQVGAEHQLSDRDGRDCHGCQRHA